MKNWIRKIFFKSEEISNKEEEKEEVVIEEYSPSIDNQGNFLKADLFEKIWIEENVENNRCFGRKKSLNDNDYIDYMVWESYHWKEMYKKHLPSSRVFRGKNPNIIFHGGCLGCLSQRAHGIERCKGCQYFKADWGKPDLSIEGEEAFTITTEELKKRMRDEE